MLDVNHDYNYGGRSAGDLVSDVVSLASFTPGQGAEPAFTLNDVVPERPSRPDPPGFEKNAHLEDFVSPALTPFRAGPSTFARGSLRRLIMIEHPSSLPHRLLDARVWRRSERSQSTSAACFESDGEETSYRP